jgi:hypothetical protein
MNFPDWRSICRQRPKRRRQVAPPPRFFDWARSEMKEVHRGFLGLSKMEAATDATQ